MKRRKGEELEGGGIGCAECRGFLQGFLFVSWLLNIPQNANCKNRFARTSLRAATLR